MFTTSFTNVELFYCWNAVLMVKLCSVEHLLTTIQKIVQSSRDTKHSNWHFLPTEKSLESENIVLKVQPLLLKITISNRNVSIVTLIDNGCYCCARELGTAKWSPGSELWKKMVCRRTMDLVWGPNKASCMGTSQIPHNPFLRCFMRHLKSPLLGCFAKLFKVLACLMVGMLISLCLGTLNDTKGYYTHSLRYPPLRGLPV